MIFYNAFDHVHYGTNAERLADTLIKAQPSAKFYEYDTKAIYITDGTTWYLM